MFRPLQVSRIQLVLLFCVWGVLCPGCYKYGSVSHEASEYAQAVYALCNRKDLSRVDSLEQKVRDAAAAGEIEQFEENYLLEILELARREKWDDANRNARRLLEEQQR